MEPNLKPLHGSPMLFVMAMGYVMLLASIVYLTQKRAESIDRDRVELTRLLQKCLDEKRR